ARMALNEFVYDPNSTSNSALINLVQGTVSFVAAQVAKTGNMRVETPTATLGIRGTFVTVSVSSTDGHTVASLGLETNQTTGLAYAGACTLTHRITGNQVAVSDVASMFSVSPTGTISASAKPAAIAAIEQATFQALIPVMAAGTNLGATTGPAQGQNQNLNQNQNQNQGSDQKGGQGQGATNASGPPGSSDATQPTGPDNGPGNNPATNPGQITSLAPVQPSTPTNSPVTPTNPTPITAAHITPTGATTDVADTQTTNSQSASFNLFAQASIFNAATPT